jgi:Carboxypeptidase regulatory-like domain
MKKTLLTTFNNSMRTLWVAIAVLMASSVNAQVTTSSIGGVVYDSKTNETLIGASVIAIHVPSGSRYGTVTNEVGQYFIPAVRVGGPYKLTSSFVGYKEIVIEDIYAALGTTTNVSFQLGADEKVIDVVTVTAERGESGSKTGAASTVNSKQLAVLPSIGARSINDFTKYNAQGNGRNFAGQDSRLNNITIDGSVFNNGFGLGNQAAAGGRTGSTAISLDAIEEIQVNVAPFDIRQSGFVGAGVNAVTRSGNNEFSGSAYMTTRNQDNVGRNARNLPVSIANFSENVIGARLGGPIIKDKLFFFANYERQRRVDPGTPYVAAGSTNPGIATRVLKSDMDDLRAYLKSKFNYETGEYENFNYLTNSDKLLIRLDYNINDFHKLNIRYSQHESKADLPISNSNSLGNGNRTLRADGLSMSFENSGYYQKDNTRSLVAELNSTFGSKMSNTFIVSYNLQDEDRAYKGAIFPTIDIKNNGSTYMAAGFDPFTPNNKLNYTTFQLTDNMRFYSGNKTFTLGASYERFKSNNMFFPGSHGVYTFESLADFYAAADAFKASPATIPNISTSTRLQYRYSALPGGADPLQVLGVNSFAIYGQEEMQVTKKFNFTLGLRANFVTMDNTALTNKYITDYLFKDPNNANAPIQINTGVMPATQILMEPRLGFNYDMQGDKSLVVRGGTGIFTGRPPFVWLSNQIGNNGVLTGLINQQGKSLVNSAGQPVNIFTNDPSTFKPANPTIPASFDLALTDPNFKFPQVWKSNLAIDHKLPNGFMLTLEGMYNQNINALVYNNYNLEPASNDPKVFVGPDKRPRFGASGVTAAAPAADNAIRVQDNVSNLLVMRSVSQGYNYVLTAKIEKKLSKNWGGMLAYTRQNTKDLMTGGTIASVSNVAQVNGVNTLPLSTSDFDLPHRVIGYASYRFDYGQKSRFGGGLTLTLGIEGARSGRYSYTMAGDMNGDGITNNDLLFVPASANDIVFVSNTVSTTNITYTPAEQAAAFDKFIEQDKYLSLRRGQYTERNGGLLPWLTTFDFSVVKDFNLNYGKKNTLQLRMDFLNFGNLLNKNWGVGNRLVAAQPLVFVATGADGKPTYRLNTQTVTNPEGTSSTFLLRETYVNRNSISDVWVMQFGIRYIFN